MQYENFMERIVDDCVRTVLNKLKYGRAADRLRDWNLIRKKVYPILLSTEDNRELLEELASTPMLDLSVAYIIRFSMDDESIGSMKISRKVLNHFGISIKMLHEQAMENLAKDGYKFQDMNSLIRKMLPPEAYDELPIGKEEGKEMHILTNSCKTYGAAGILDKELLKKFAEEQDYFILPSSIHETIFVPVNGGFSKGEFDNMVAEVNATQVSVEERLTNHCYYYDAGIGEIRICA